MIPVADTTGKTDAGKSKKTAKNTKNAQQQNRKKTSQYGKVIRKYREKAEVSQRQASRELGYSSSAFCNIERGVCYPQLDSVVPICDYLQIPLEEFFGRKTSGGSLSSNEEELIRRYREASPALRSALMTVLRSCEGRQPAVVQYPTGGISEQAVLVEPAQTVKRGRGRPRKERDPAEEQKPKRGRGRPRKNPLPDAAE